MEDMQHSASIDSADNSGKVSGSNDGVGVRASVQVNFDHLPSGCSMPTYTMTDANGHLDPLPSGLPSGCPSLPDGATFCGWFNDECHSRLITPEDTFTGGETIYACITCEDPSTYYDFGINQCVPMYCSDTGCNTVDLETNATCVLIKNLPEILKLITLVEMSCDANQKCGPESGSEE